MSLKDRIAGKGKSLIILVGVFLGVLLITAGHVKGEPVETGTVSLKIQDVRYENDYIDIIYSILNSSSKTVWVCEYMVVDDMPFETRVFSKQKRIELVLESYKMRPGVFTDAKFAIYRRVAPDSNQIFKLKVKTPVKDDRLFHDNPCMKKSDSIEWDEIEVIRLESGYFIEQLDMISEEYSEKTSSLDKIWVSSYWPGISGEKTVSDEIKLRGK